MAIIVPTITAENPHVYREQIERVQGFATRIHIDLMDGIFTPNKSVLPSQVWWPDALEADIHVKCGIALLANTPVSQVVDVLPFVQQLLIFSGNLGHQGGSTADVSLLTKVKQAKKMNPSIELAWDGGVNEDNVEEIANGGIGVINAGGYIHGAKDPEAAYAQLAQMV